MNDYVRPSMADPHREDNLDEVRPKTVEPMQSGGGSMRREAFRSAVEDGRQHVLVPRLWRGGKAEHRWRESLDNASFDKSPEVLLAEAGFRSIEPGEQAELACSHLRQLANRSSAQRSSHAPRYEGKCEKDVERYVPHATGSVGSRRSDGRTRSARPRSYF